jgi:hypothetical protein
MGKSKSRKRREWRRNGGKSGWKVIGIFFAERKGESEKIQKIFRGGNGLGQSAFLTFRSTEIMSAD